MNVDPALGEWAFREWVRRHGVDPRIERRPDIVGPYFWPVVLGMFLVAIISVALL